MTKKRYIGLALCSWLVIGTLGFFFFMRKSEQQRTIVDAIHPKDTVLYFYRDDCRDCQSVYPILWFYRVFHPGVVMINLNQLKNRRFISSYFVTEVPTVITPKHRYSGTDRKALIKLLSSKKGEFQWNQKP